MSLSPLTANLNNITSLPDKPSLSTTELKQKFDKAGNDIKDYINDIHLSEVEELINATVQANKTTVENVLDSTSTTNALSSAQGKILKDSVDELSSGKQKKITVGTNAPTGGSDGDIYLQYF